MSTTSDLRNPAYRQFAGYEGDRPIHLSASDSGAALVVDQFRDDERYVLTLITKYGDEHRIRRCRGELLAMARDIIERLEG